MGLFSFFFVKYRCSFRSMSRSKSRLISRPIKEREIKKKDLIRVWTMRGRDRDATAGSCRWRLTISPTDSPVENRRLAVQALISLSAKPRHLSFLHLVISSTSHRQQPPTTTANDPISPSSTMYTSVRRHWPNQLVNATRAALDASTAQADIEKLQVILPSWTTLKKATFKKITPRIPWNSIRRSILAT